LKERIVEERETKYGKRIVKQIGKKLIIEKQRIEQTKEKKEKRKPEK
jgi:hypothetical protein